MTLAAARHAIAASLARPPSFLRNHFSKLGTAEVTGSGEWTAEYVDAHFSALEQELERLRAHHGRARVLVDLSKADVQPPATAARISYWTDRIYLPQDRVAVVHDSASVRSQMKDRVMIAVFEVFESEVAARMWLYQD